MIRSKFLLLLLIFVPFVSYSVSNKGEQPYGINLACAEFAERNMTETFPGHIIYRRNFSKECGYGI